MIVVTDEQREATRIAAGLTVEEYDAKVQEIKRKQMLEALNGGAAAPSAAVLCADPAEIERTLRLWFAPGEVYELRCVNALTSAKGAKGSIVGYFDSDHISEMVDGAPG
jgi:hypothetical protein